MIMIISWCSGLGKVSDKNITVIFHTEIAAKNVKANQSDWRKATTRDEWRHILDTATLQWSTL